jgi:transmembrane sensor
MTPNYFTNKELAELLDRFLAGQSSPEEHKRVVQWMEELGEEADLIVSETERKEIEERLMRKLEYAIDEKQPTIQAKELKFSGWTPVGIAASILLLISFAFYTIYKPSNNNFDAHEQGTYALPAAKEVVNNTNKVTEVSLEDGSRILLHPDSRISFDVQNKSGRIVKLQGEAFFDVARYKNRPFIVYTQEVTTTVLGTSFTIKAPGHGKLITVAVSTGKVAVSSAANKSNASKDNNHQIILTPNQQAVFDPASKELTATLVQHPIVLEKKNELKLRFDEEPVADILKILENAYGVQIEYDESILVHCRVTTAFSREGLYERLNLLSKAIGATYSIQGTTIVFHSTGCH